jgi:hypothetical protein
MKVRLGNTVVDEISEELELLTRMRDEHGYIFECSEYVLRPEDDLVEALGNISDALVESDDYKNVRVLLIRH